MKTTPEIRRGTLVLLLLTLSCHFASAQLRIPSVANDTLTNFCPLNTSNLQHVLLSTPGDKQSIQWYTSTTPSGSPYASSGTAANGLYYAFLYDSLSSTFSGASAGVRVLNTSCTSSISYSSMSCNQLTPITSNRFSGVTENINAPGFACLVSGITKPATNMTDALLDNYASFLFGISANCAATFKVATTSETFPAGTYAGFKVSTGGLLGTNIGYKVTISLYNNNSTNPVQQKVVISDVVGLNPLEIGSDGLAVLGFVSDVPFDDIRITFEALIGLVFSAEVHYAVVGKYCDGPELVANTLTPINNNIFPTRINTTRSGLLCLDCSVEKPENIISPSKTDFATLNAIAGLGNTASLAVKNMKQKYTKGTFAGFVIEKPSVLSLEVLNGIKITAFRNDTLINTVSGASLLSLGSALLGGDGKHLLGFFPTQSFDEIQFTVGGLVNALGDIKVFEAVVQRFENRTLDDCYKMTSLINPDYPMALNPARTGIIENTLGLCVGCSVSETYNVLNEHENDHASINILVSALGVKGSLAVKNQTGVFPKSTFAGFEIENNSVLDLSILEALTVKTYRRDTLVGTSSGPTQLVSLNLLGDKLSGKNIIGFVSDESFDEIVLEIQNSPLLSASLSDTKIYRPVAALMCSPTLNCDSTYQLNQSELPVTLNLKRTGVSGLVCGIASVQNPSNVIDGSTTNPAVITVGVGVGCSGSISIESHNTLYPTGSTAGFVVKTENNLLQVDLLSSLTIELYRNDTLVQASTASTLLNIELLGILSNVRTFRVSVRATKAYDELRFTVNSLASVLSPVSVFSAFVNTRGSYGDILDCCSVRNYTPVVTAAQINNSCPSDEVNLAKLITGSCPYNTKTQWHNMPSGFSSSTFVTDSLIKTNGTYYAVCYDELANCYGLPSEAVNVSILDCCPTITNTGSGNTKPTVCGSGDGIITICGLVPSKTNYSIKYSRNGGSLVTLSGLTANPSGCLIINTIPQGTYNVSVEHQECPTGSNSLNIILQDPVDPDSPENVSSSSTVACSGQSVTLTATCSTGTPAWFSDAALNHVIVSPINPTTPNTYYVVCKLGTCQSSPKSINIGITSIPATVPVISTNKSMVCGTEKATLSGFCATGEILTWSDNQTGNSILAGAGTYTATCKNSCGESPVSNTIIITSLKPTNVAASETNICPGKTVGLSAECAVGNPVWFSDEALIVSVSDSVNPLITSTYYVVCLDGSCKSIADSLEVTVTSITIPAGVTPVSNTPCSVASTSLKATCSVGLPVWFADSSLQTQISDQVTPLSEIKYYVICALSNCNSIAVELTVQPNTVWLNSDCDGDGVTNGGEITSSSPQDPLTDHLDPCDYNESEQVLQNVSEAWKVLDCDGDGNPNNPDPNPRKAVAQNDTLTAPAGSTSLVNVLANDDFLPGPNTSLQRVAGGSGGTATGSSSFNNLTGEMSYNPALSEAGTIQTIAYQVCNIGADSTVCATALVTITIPHLQTCVSDFNTAIKVLPTNSLVNSDPILIVVSVKEVAGCESDGSSLIVVVPKVAQFTFDWPAYSSSTNITEAAISGLSNSDWTYSEDPGYWIWTYNKPSFGAGDISKIGFLGVWNAGATSGKINVTSTVINGSGGETNFLNNTDQEVINFNINP